MTEAEEIAQLQQDILALQHAVQTGVAYEHQAGSDDGSPKHLRVGVNSALIQVSAMCRLLIDKGVITELEYWKFQRQVWIEEKERYTERLSARYNIDIKLV